MEGFQDASGCAFTPLSFLLSVPMCPVRQEMTQFRQKLPKPDMQSVLLKETDRAVIFDLVTAGVPAEDWPS